MAATEVLFIGGPIDGRRMAVRDLTRTIEFPVRSEDGFGRVEYRRTELLDQNGSHYVYTCGDPGSVVLDLMNGYREEKGHGKS